VSELAGSFERPIPHRVAPSITASVSSSSRRSSLVSPATLRRAPSRIFSVIGHGRSTGITFATARAQLSPRFSATPRHHVMCSPMQTSQSGEQPWLKGDTRSMQRSAWRVLEGIRD
jgi:hypothetical protein